MQEICVVCSVRKDLQQIVKAEFYNIVVSLFQDKWLAAALLGKLTQDSLEVVGRQLPPAAALLN